MDMTSDMSSDSTMMGMMKPYLHFTPGDFLYFSNVHPSSNGGMAAACLVLFSLAFCERLLAAYNRITEKKWGDELMSITHASKRPLTSQTFQSRLRMYPDEKKEKFEPFDDIQSVHSVNENVTVFVGPRPTPFVTKIEIKRGLQRSLGGIFAYALMLAVMTFNATFILAIIAGLGFGEMAFGRFAA